MMQASSLPEEAFQFESLDSAGAPYRCENYRGLAENSPANGARAGLKDCRVHTLRHTSASRLIQNGMSVYEAREILGHSDIKTTMRYAHLELRQVTSKARDVINRLNQRNK